MWSPSSRGSNKAQRKKEPRADAEHTDEEPQEEADKKVKENEEENIQMRETSHTIARVLDANAKGITPDAGDVEKLLMNMSKLAVKKNGGAMPKEAEEDIAEKVKEFVELFDRNGRKELQQGKGLNRKARRPLAKKEKSLVSEVGM